MKILPLITFFVGGAIGGAVAYILTCNRYKNEIKDINEFYNAEIDKVKESLDRLGEEEVADVKTVNNEEEVHTFDRNSSKIGKVDYSAIKPTENAEEATLFTTDEDIDKCIDNYEKMVENFKYDPMVNTDEYPRLITDAEMSASIGYNCVGIDYYIKDRLCFYEDQDIPIDDLDLECLTVDNLIGEANLKAFDIFDVNTIYVKNEETHQIFEINKVEGDSPVSRMHLEDEYAFYE